MLKRYPEWSQSNFNLTTSFFLTIFLQTFIHSSIIYTADLFKVMGKLAPIPADFGKETRYANLSQVLHRVRYPFTLTFTSMSRSNFMQSAPRGRSEGWREQEKVPLTGSVWPETFEQRPFLLSKMILMNHNEKFFNFFNNEVTLYFSMT